MESQWNATFYGKIELKFQNIFQITVTMNCNCMQDSLYECSPLGLAKEQPAV